MKKIDIDLDAVKKMYIEDGLTCIEIANKLGVGKTTITTFLSKNGVKKSKEEIFKNKTERYKKTCLEKYGVENAFQSEKVKDKSKQTMLEKYGVENAFQSDIIKEKAKQTCLDKYGVESFSQTKEYTDKIKQTCLEKYGVENAAQSDIIKEKYKKTCLEKYGVEYAVQSDVVREKSKQTMLEKYGVENASQLEEVREKAKQTCLERYGAEYANQSDVVRERTKQTCLEKYGVENAAQSDSVKEKIKQTCIEKYGVENVLQSEEVKNKIKKTCLERYGVEKFSQTKEYSDKYKQTCLERYGVENVSQYEEIKDKKKQTFLERYGVECLLQSDKVREKAKQAMLEKYGVENPSQKDISAESMKILSSKETLQNFINNCEVKTTKDISSKLNIAYTTLNTYVNKYDLRDLIDYSISSGESEVKEYIESLGVEVIRDRSILDGKEIDIYCPDYKIGVEFNGDYWHSDIKRPKNYHYEKSLKCQEKGVRLIHIYEHEWNNPVKQNIIKSMLKIAFGKVESRIYARNCEIREMTNVEARDFNNANHLQGHKNAQVTYGLFYEDNLVQLMSFSYYPKKGWWEIERGCPGSNNVVVGGVSKLFKHFLKEHNPDKVFSYCDFNKFDGVGYEKLGMELLGYTGPDMKWLLNDGAVVNRQPSKHKELSENAQGKIWGAGSKRYLWKK